jgi:hypothetical protein
VSGRSRDVDAVVDLDVEVTHDDSFERHRSVATSDNQSSLPKQYSMACGGSLVDRAELSRYHLRLPFRIERDAENGVAPIAQELEYGQSPLRRFIASSQLLDDDVGRSFALRTPAIHE